MDSLSGGGIGAREQVRWATGSEDWGWATLGVWELCCEVGYGVGTTLGEQGDALYIWTWGALVGATGVIGVGSGPGGIEVPGRVIMWGDVGGVVGTTLGVDTRDGRAM